MNRSLALRRGGLLGCSLIALAVLYEFIPMNLTPAKFTVLSAHDTESEPSVSPDGRMLAYTASSDGVPRIMLRPLAQSSSTALTSGPDRSPRFSPDGNDVLFVRSEGHGQSLHAVSIHGRSQRKLADDAFAGDWSPDGLQVAFLRRDVNQGVAKPWAGSAWPELTWVVVRSVEDGRERTVGRVDSAALCCPRWSPDQRWIAVSATFHQAGAPDHFVQLIQVDSTANEPPHVVGEPTSFGVILRSGLTGPLSSVAWIDDGRALVFSQEVATQTLWVGGVLLHLAPSRLLLYELATGRVDAVLESRDRSDVLDVSPQGEVFRDLVRDEQRLCEFLLSQGSSARTPLTATPRTIDRQPIYSPNGTHIAFSSNRAGTLDVWLLSTVTAGIQRFTTHDADDYDPAFSRDGRRLIWSSLRSGRFEIWMANADGSDARQITDDGSNAQNATATPDGQWLVYNSIHPEKKGVWKIRTDGTNAQQIVHGETRWPEVSPDGRFVSYVAVTPNDSVLALRIVRLVDGSELPFQVRTGGRLPNARHRWSPDGTAILFTWANAHTSGIYRQFVSDSGDTLGIPRPLVRLGANEVVESFGISPDGTRLAASLITTRVTLNSISNIRTTRPSGFDLRRHK